MLELIDAIVRNLKNKNVGVPVVIVIVLLAIVYGVDIYLTAR